MHGIEDHWLRNALQPTWLTEQLRSQIDLTAQHVREEQLRRRFVDQQMLVLPSPSEIIRQRVEFDLIRNSAVPNIAFEEAMRAAESTRTLILPGELEGYRTPSDLLAAKLLDTQSMAWWRDSQHLLAFTEASAFSDLLTYSARVDRDLRDASSAFRLTDIPPTRSISEYGHFLNAAGLILPRWPQARLLSAAERRRRFRIRLDENREPAHVRKAKSLVHRYEGVLLEIIDAGMASEFGEDWAERRLVLCNCNDLLGKWRRRGGSVLDHADFTHYARIMSHPEHFEAVFALGFDDREALRDLLLTAGTLRARSHHPGKKFTPANLRDLRITWRTIEKGLVPLTPAYTIEV